MTDEEAWDFGAAVTRLLKARGKVQQRRNDLELVMRIYNRTHGNEIVLLAVLATEREINT